MSMILSAFSDEYAKAFAEQLAGMARLGIGYIELRGVNGKNVAQLSDTELCEVKAMLDCYGIRVSAIGSPLGKVRLDSDIDAHLDTAHRIFETAQMLESRYVRIFSFYAPEGEDIACMKDGVTDALGRMIDASKAYRLTLCHENEALIYGDTPKRCRELLDAFPGELACVFDMGNFVLGNVHPYPDAYLLLRDHIAYFHIKDALYEGAVVPPGKGEAEIGRILSSHAAYTDGDFFVSLEPHLETFSGLNALAGRKFENPYKYKDTQSAFTDAVNRFRELVKI